MEVTITENTATTYQVRGLPCAVWADITIRSWDGGGAIDCQSVFGNFSNNWCATGSKSFVTFLCGLDMDYFMKKTRPKDYLVFSSSKTLEAMKKEILQVRKTREMDKEQARGIWDEFAECRLEGIREADDFYKQIQQTTCDLDDFYEEPADLPVRTEYSMECVNFWEHIWPLITKYWKEKQK